MNTDNAQKGIEWWNGLTKEAREIWLKVANSATPADAWAAYQKSVNIPVLYVYRTSSGQWAGKLVDDEGQEVMRISGCDHGQQVVDEAREGGFGDFTVTMLDEAP